MENAHEGGGGVYAMRPKRQKTLQRCLLDLAPTRFVRTAQSTCTAPNSPGLRPEALDPTYALYCTRVLRSQETDPPPRATTGPLA